MNYNLYKGDCLEVLEDLIDPHSIDLVLCDPPYGSTSYEWDRVIPFEKFWSLLDRVCTSNANILLFGSDPFSAFLKASNLKEFKYDLIWVKNTASNFVHAKNMPLKNVEYISVFSKASIGHKSLLGDNRMTYNPQGIVKCDHYDGRKNGKFKEWGSGLRGQNRFISARPSHKERYKVEAKNYPKQVLNFDVIHNSKKMHPNEKPLPLLEYLIKTYSNENSTVLDPCMGSCSCGLACLKTKRNFAGIELDPNMFSISEKRMQEHEQQ